MQKNFFTLSTLPTFLATYFLIPNIFITVYFYKFFGLDHLNFQVNFINLVYPKMIGYLILAAAVGAVIASVLIWAIFGLCQRQLQNSRSISSSRTPRRQIPTRPASPRSQTMVNELTERLQKSADQGRRGGTPELVYKNNV